MDRLELTRWAAARRPLPSQCGRLKGPSDLSSKSVGLFWPGARSALEISQRAQLRFALLQLLAGITPHLTPDCLPDGGSVDATELTCVSERLRLQRHLRDLASVSMGCSSNDSMLHPTI